MVNRKKPIDRPTWNALEYAPSLALAFGKLKPGRAGLPVNAATKFAVENELLTLFELCSEMTMELLKKTRSLNRRHSVIGKKHETITLINAQSTRSWAAGNARNALKIRANGVRNGLINIQPAP